MSGRPGLHRVLPRDAERFEIVIDGEPVEAFLGESLLVAMLSRLARLRVHETDGAPRAGFCLMGACQECWVLCEDGHRLRACTTPVTAGMRVRTGAAVARDG